MKFSLIQFIHDTSDQKEIPNTIFIGTKEKAFDTIYHAILLLKLNNIGITVGILRHLKFILSFQAMRSVYFDLVHSNLGYWLLIFLNLFKTHIKRLQASKTVNKAQCILRTFIPSPISLPSKSPIKSMFSFLNIFPVELLLSFHGMIF